MPSSQSWRAKRKTQTRVVGSSSRATDICRILIRSQSKGSRSAAQLSSTCVRRQAATAADKVKRAQSNRASPRPTERLDYTQGAVPSNLKSARSQNAHIKIYRQDSRDVQRARIQNTHIKVHQKDFKVIGTHQKACISARESARFVQGNCMVLEKIFSCDFVESSSVG